MEESSKRRKPGEEEDDGQGSNTNKDRLSSLPDSLLCHILSFLPTKTSVCTMSLVSHRYLHLWKHLQDFDFYDVYYPDFDEEAENFKDFAIFINAVLSMRSTRDIRKMRLSCGQSQLDLFAERSVDTWIRTAVGPHLEDLHLALFSSEGEGFKLPLPVLSCTNLLSISLYGEIFVELEQSWHVCLPSLKTLQLEIGNVDVNSVDILLSACPILETLELSFSTESLAKLRVPSSLKSFKFTIENDTEVCLEIDTPGLKYLSLTNITFGNATSIGNLHNVEEAYLDASSESESVDPLLTLLQALSGIKRLVFRCYAAKRRLLGTEPIIDFPKMHFSEFRCLLHLELILPTFDPFLYDVLQKCPILQALIIHNDKDTSPVKHSLTAKPKSVPNCLVSHLTYIHFKGYTGYWHEKEFAGYVLQYGLVLKTMLISGFLSNESKKSTKYHYRRKFSNMPRGSTVCQVKFD